MRKWILILLSVLLLVSGCTNRGTEYEKLPAEEFDNSGEKIVIYSGKHDFPLSYTVDGNQQIENGTYWYYEFNDILNKGWQDSFYTYELKKLDLNGSKSYDKAIRGKCYATNGNWPLFLSPVHSEYSSSNQNMVGGNLLELIKQCFTAKKLNAEDVVVTETWSCDIDDDKQQETFFIAHSCEEPSAGMDQWVFGYINEDSCQILYEHETKDNQKFILSPIVCDLNGDQKWSLLLHKKGDFESFVSFNYSDGNFTKYYEIIF